MSIYPFPGPEGRLVAVSWQQRLKSARSEMEVLDVARDFVATFSPYDLARLPEPCRPGRIVDANDVNELAFVLVRHDHDDGRGTARRIRRLANFFTNASVRLTELASSRGAREMVAASRAAPARDRPSAM
jgi:hypothetical protein